MRVLTVVRTAPVRLSARLHSSDQEAGMTTAEYAVGTNGTGVLGRQRRGRS